MKRSEEWMWMDSIQQRETIKKQHAFIRELQQRLRVMQGAIPQNDPAQPFIDNALDSIWWFINEDRSAP